MCRSVFKTKLRKSIQRVRLLLSGIKRFEVVPSGKCTCAAFSILKTAVKAAKAGSLTTDEMVKIGKLNLFAQVYSGRQGVFFRQHVDI